MNKLLISLLALLLASPLHAAITGVSGTVSENSTLTITGSGFGTKSPAAPLLWDNFDSGTSGGNLGGSWQAMTSIPLKYSSTTPYGGNGLSAWNRVQYGNDHAQKFSSARRSVGQHTSLYFSCMSRHIGPSVKDSAGNRVYKNGRINQDYDLRTGDILGYASPHMTAISDGYIFYRVNGTSTYPTVRSFPDIGNAEWRRHQIFRSPSLIFGHVHQTRHDYTGSFGSPNLSLILLGTMLDAPLPGETHDMYIDDVYVDNTQARVELCTGSTWSNRGACDPQIPFGTWSDTSLTVKVNQGKYVNNQTVYIYVVNSSGTVQSYGSSLTVASDVVAPSTITCYLNGDGDGYGTGVSEIVESCSFGYYEAPQLIQTFGDCDDTDAGINPGAFEICNNGIDENCDGVDPACETGTTISAASMFANRYIKWIPPAE